MNKYAWMLVVPYVVTVSTEMPIKCRSSVDPGFYGRLCDKRPLVTLTHNGEFYDEFDATPEKVERAEDMAEALNEAHFRRTKPPLTQKDLEVSISCPQGSMNPCAVLP